MNNVEKDLLHSKIIEEHIKSLKDKENHLQKESSTEGLNRVQENSIEKQLCNINFNK